MLTLIHKPVFKILALKALAVFAVVFIFFVPPAPAEVEEEKALIENIKLANTRDDLLVYFDVKKAFAPKINEAVLNGIPTTFSFYIDLYKTNGSWFNKKISSIQIKSTLKYNSLKKEFTVSRPWSSNKTIVTESFDTAKELMTEIDNLKILSLERLAKSEKYQLRIKAELDKVTLPLSLHYVLFFVSFWDFETNWYVINFTY